MKFIVIVISLLVFSCKKDEELTGRTSKGDLKSPCVSTQNGPCSPRFNPNFV